MNLVASLSLALGLFTPVWAADTQPAVMPQAAGFSELEELLRLRDPFKRISLAEVPQAPKPPLERFPVDKFRLIGVLTGPERLRAMVVDPDGKNHIVSEKMKIGLRDGIIHRIYSDRIIVREKTKNILGQLENADQIISMGAAPGSKTSGSAK